AFFHQSPKASVVTKFILPQLAQIMALLLSVQGFFLISQLGITIGGVIVPYLGKMAFLGNFIKQLSDVTLTTLPAVLAISGGAFLGGLLGNLGRKLNEQLPYHSLTAINILVSLSAGAILFMIIAAVIGWLYEIQNLPRFYLIFGVFGAAFGAAMVGITRPRQPLPIGLILYTITRTVLNVVRSIEALIMAIVAVIWVGIGPFAGVLALGLHTIASLAKLYSEQVESILPGPLEAVTATGATRLQTIIYAVIPQIIPPYISFTMYRWDINVRMSTIIGFAGGGGIGFLLIQNINLLNYRAASTQMLAIAIVVAAMDYFSSWMREKFV
ncbi:MAG: PhnE/PtxC family ABC transporter permease, partial [Anaerolineales bacterium]